MSTYNEEVKLRLIACLDAFDGITTNDVRMIASGGGVRSALAVSAQASIADSREILALMGERNKLQADLAEALEIVRALGDRKASEITILHARKLLIRLGLVGTGPSNV